MLGTVGVSVPGGNVPTGGITPPGNAGWLGTVGVSVLGGNTPIGGITPPGSSGLLGTVGVSVLGGNTPIGGITPPGKLGIAGTVPGLVLVHVTYGIPFTTLFFRNYYSALPQELIQAARLDGAGFWQIFWRIILPLSAPILMVTLIWQFTNIWNDFLFGVAFTGSDSKPITVGLNNLANTTSSVKFYNIDMAAAMIAALPTIAIYVLAGKFFVRGLTAGAVKG